MPERDVKGQREHNSPIQASVVVLVCSPHLINHKWREIVPSGRFSFADVILYFSGVDIYFLLKTRPFFQSFFDVHAPRQSHAVS